MSGSVQVDSDHVVSDLLGLNFRVPFSPTSIRNTGGMFYTKTEWRKINCEVYVETCDNILNKIKVPFHLLMHGTKDPTALDIYCSEIIHAMKVAESAAEPKCRLRKGTRRPGWDECPSIKVAKRLAKLWYHI